MPFHFKIKPEDSLCASCENGSFIKDDQNEIRIHCSEYGRWIKFKVRECSDYEIKGTLPLYALQDMAWYIDPNKKNGIGFVPPGTEEHRQIKNKPIR